MRIPKEYLEEKNYEGSRLVEVKDTTVLKLRNDIKELASQMKPYLDKMDALKIDPYNTERVRLKKELTDLEEKWKGPLEQYHEEYSEVRKLEDKITLLKNKISPRVNKILDEAKEVGEFERADKVVDKDDGKLYVEIIDEIEEKIKSVRTAKQTK